MRALDFGCMCQPGHRLEKSNGFTSLVYGFCAPVRFCAFTRLVHHCLLKCLVEAQIACFAGTRNRRRDASDRLVFSSWNRRCWQCNGLSRSLSVRGRSGRGFGRNRGNQWLSRPRSRDWGCDHIEVPSHSCLMDVVSPHDGLQRVVAKEPVTACARCHTELKRRRRGLRPLLTEPPLVFVAGLFRDVASLTIVRAMTFVVRRRSSRGGQLLRFKTLQNAREDPLPDGLPTIFRHVLVRRRQNDCRIEHARKVDRWSRVRRGRIGARVIEVCRAQVFGHVAADGAPKGPALGDFACRSASINKMLR